jgi:predicted glycosyltransferase
VSRERVLETIAEVRSLIDEQNKLLTTGPTFFEMSVEDLAAYAQRHARIRQLSKELKQLSYSAERSVLSC